MREIKFRAWDSARKEMFLPESDIEGKSGTMVIIYGKKDKTIGWGLYNLQPEYRITSGEYPENVLMQSTDLKDKNGKEIYEGDCYLHTWGDNTKVMYQVYWHNGGFMYGIPSQNIGWSVYEDWATRTEIIGNIYSNPELLTTP